MVTKLARGALAALIVMSIASMVFAQEEGKSKRTGRFAVKELMQVVNPEMVGILQVDICADERVHRSQMVPSREGGITKTRVVVRSEKKDSPWLIASDQEPPYKMYRIITHGDIATSPWADTDEPTSPWADTDADDDSSGSVPLEEPGADIIPTLSWAGAEHILLGTVSFGGVYLR